MNRLFIKGNVTRDADLKNVNVGGVDTPCCRFSVAVNENRSNGEPIVTYFEVTLWRQYAAKLAPYLVKGREVIVEGHVRLNQYIDANRAVRSSMQIHSATVELVGKKPEPKAESMPAEDFDDEELPFC